jgi:hypothetical protein
LQFPFLGHPDRLESELGVVGHRHAAPELPVVQAGRGRRVRKRRPVPGAYLPDLP